MSKPKCNQDGQTQDEEMAPLPVHCVVQMPTIKSPVLTESEVKRQYRLKDTMRSAL